MTSNDNIIDAVLLDCPRIGHGLNLYRFPVLFERIRKHNVCVEWNPLSNQVSRQLFVGSGCNSAINRFCDM